MSDLKELDKTYVAGTYARFPVALVRGEGSLAYDEDGKRYIDMGSGIGVTAFGFADGLWQQAVTAQLGMLQHTSNLYYSEPCVRLAKMLCERTGMKKVFFSNSGGLLHHRHPEKQLPRPDHYHPGRHRPGPLPRTVPAPDPGLRPYPRQRHRRSGENPVSAQGGGSAPGVHPGGRRRGASECRLCSGSRQTLQGAGCAADN